MTRQQFIDSHYHELYGLIADAFCVNRTGADLSRAMQLAADKVRERLGRIHDQLTKPEPVQNQPQTRAGTPPAAAGQHQGRK